jgi:hypothetical protein
MAKSTSAKKASGKKRATRKRSSSKKAGTKKYSAKKSTAKKKAPRKWSKKVNETSDAMDLEQGVFKGNDPKKIAQSVKRSAGKSKRKKAGPYQSAMSMLNFYINRGGKNLPASKKKVLERSKDELRKLFGREEE